MEIEIIGHEDSDRYKLADTINKLNINVNATVRNNMTENISNKGVILTVSLMDGPMPDTKKQLILSYENNLSVKGIVFTKLAEFNKQKVYGQEIIKMVEIDAMELCSKIGYDDTKIPSITTDVNSVANKELEEFLCDILT